MSVDLKSLAHKNWPYAGTAHEWRGFVKKPKGQLASASYIVCGENGERVWADGRAVDPDYPFVYQKQNFGPELP